MKTTLLTAAIAALGMTSGCASNNAGDSTAQSTQNPNFRSQQVSSSYTDLGDLDHRSCSNYAPLNLDNQFTLADIKSFNEDEAIVAGAAVTLANAIENDSSFIGFLNDSYGVVVFPMVANTNAQGFNRGIVIEQGNFVGECSTNAQMNSESPAFSQIVFFENKNAFNAFRSSGFALRDGTPTFPIVQGASEWARYTQGVAVFTTAGESNDQFAPAGGQSFTFFDINE